MGIPDLDTFCFKFTLNTGAHVIGILSLALAITEMSFFSLYFTKFNTVECLAVGL